MAKRNSLLIASSLTFCVPLLQSLYLPCGRWTPRLYSTLLLAMTCSSVAVHSGKEKWLKIDKTLIYIWILMNSNLLFKISNKKKALLSGFLVLFLGGSKLYQKHVLLHFIMHLSGSMGTFILLRNWKKEIIC